MGARAVCEMLVKLTAGVNFTIQVMQNTKTRQKRCFSASPLYAEDAIKF